MTPKEDSARDKMDLPPDSDSGSGSDGNPLSSGRDASPQSGSRSFLRQSAWMIIATVAGGGGMVLVHAVVRARCGADAYSEFKALLSSFYIIAAAAGGLWTLFAQRTAAAVGPEAIRSVALGARRVAVAILALWLVLAVALWWGQSSLMSLWKLSNPWSLWGTWLLGLFTLWTSLTRGLVQGRQNFTTLGIIAILDGFGRFAAVFVIVTFLGGMAAGAVFGAVLGCIAALTVGLYGSHEVWRLPGSRFEWKSWLNAFYPLAAATGSIQILQQYDNMFWQALIPAARWETWNLGALYSPAQTVGFGITQFTIPLALVMLPRVARSAAMGEKTQTVQLTALCTVIMGGAAATVCTLLPKLPLQIMFVGTPDNWAAAPLVPWFAWSMLIMTLAWVFLNDLFARTRFAVVPWVVAIALTYVIILRVLSPHFLTLQPAEAYRLGVQILGAHNLVLLGVAWFFSWKTGRDQGGLYPSQGISPKATAPQSAR